MNGFGKEGVEAKFFVPTKFAVQNVGAKGDNRRARPCLRRLRRDGAHGCQPIHHGHADIHDADIEGARTHQLNCGSTILG